MKLTKAIEITEGLQVDLTINLSDDRIRANQLLIEAAKVIEAVRPYSNTNKSYYLPGETKD